MYLVDTNVISAAAPSKAAPPAGMIAWMDAHSEGLYLSAVSVAEIRSGIAKSEREGATRKARDLAAWLETVLHLYADRVLAFDIDVAQAAGLLMDRARGKGLAPGMADIVIAATAKHHGLTILTRNLKDFNGLGVPVLDPFAALPPA